MVRKQWNIMINYFPLFGFVLVAAVFTVLTKGAIVNSVSLQSLLSQVMTTALVSIGAVFVFGSGSFDMSIGGCVCISAVIAGYAAIATGSLAAALLTAVGISMMLGLLKGLFAAYVEVPLFIVTIVMGAMVTAVVLVMMGNDVTIYLNDAMKPIRAFSYGELSAINLLVLGAFFLFCLVLFNYTRLGREIRMLGGNPATARQTGMNPARIKLLAFLISGLGTGLAAFILLIRLRTVGTTTAGTLGSDILVAIVLGGMPLTGGPRSRISAGIIGAATITVLNAGLTMMGLNLAVIQVSRAVIFLAVVYIASMTYRSRLLPR
jgi:ribose transport system permease protein